MSGATPNRSPERLIALSEALMSRVALYVGTQLSPVYDAEAAALDRDAANVLRALADAAGQAAPVPPPVEGLETTDEERIAVLGPTGTRWNQALGRDFAKVHDRAEGLAKEVERLTARGNALEETQRKIVEEVSSNWRARVEALEAKLAVYEAPIGEMETTPEELSKHRREMTDWDREGVFFRLLRDFDRLSAAHAECKGENTKLRELLKKTSDYIASPVRHSDDKVEEDRRGELVARARAALAPASGKKAT